MATTNFKVKLKDVRLSFPALFRAEVREHDDGNTSKKFKASFLIDQKAQGALLDEIEDQIEACIVEKWGKDRPKLKAEKLCLRDGDEEEYDGYAGMMYISASNNKRPPVVDRRRNPVTEEDGVVYAGCYVNATLHIWAQDNKHGKRVNASLEAVQFVRDGEAFGAGNVDVDEEFDVIEDDEDERPARRNRARDEDDEDERPARRNRARDEDDEDERPARRNRSRDNDVL